MKPNKKSSQELIQEFTIQYERVNGNHYPHALYFKSPWFVPTNKKNFREYRCWRRKQMEEKITSLKKRTPSKLVRSFKKYLCYYELHVADRTFYVHVIVNAENEGKALDKLVPKGHETKTYHFQAKGCLGEFTKKRADKYMNLNEMV